VVISVQNIVKNVEDAMVISVVYVLRNTPVLLGGKEFGLSHFCGKVENFRRLL